MSISNEIKRMMSLLESELGNVKPLITEVGDPQIDTSTSPLDRSLKIDCWGGKGFTTDGQVYTLGRNYVYAFSKIAPEVREKDRFLKVITKDGTNLYCFEKPSTDPAALSVNPKAYLAVKRNTEVKASTDPNLNYLSAHGWYCPGFDTTQNLTSQQTNLSGDQQQQIETLVSALGAQDTGYTFYTKKPEDGKNYVKIDLATGTGDDGNNYIDKFNLSTRIGPFKSQPNKFFIFANVGTQEKLIDLVTKVETFLNGMGYTRTQALPGTAEDMDRNVMSLNKLCAEKGKEMCSSSTLQQYIKTDGDRRIWRMNAQQMKDAKNVSYKDVVAAQAELGKQGAKQGLRALDKQKANKPACQSAIQQLSNCEKYGTDEDCAEALGLAAVDATYTKVLDDTIKLVKTCVQNEVGLGMFSKNIKAQLTQLQGSTSPYGLREPVTAKKDVSLEESLNNSIKSVITETINKNNNKNLDSIIKNNLRRYIR
jgi:hypothetical protein